MKGRDLKLGDVAWWIPPPSATEWPFFLSRLPVRVSPIKIEPEDPGGPCSRMDAVGHEISYQPFDEFFETEEEALDALDQKTDEWIGEECIRHRVELRRLRDLQGAVKQRLSELLGE